MIEKETRTAEKIITDLLDFARIKSVDRSFVSVPDLLERVLARCPVPENVHVNVQLPTDLPEVFVDSRQVEQVLGNLIVNACQAMPDGGQLSVSSSQYPVISDLLNTGSLNTGPLNTARWLLITVEDTGVGIPPEKMGQLFEPLFTTKPKGIGLGLTISKKLIEANGGRIEAQSEAGRGSTFTVFLPLERRELQA